MVNYSVSGEYPQVGAALNGAFTSMGGAERLNLGANQFVSGGLQALHGAGIATVGTGNMAVGLPVATGEYLVGKMSGGRRRKSHRKNRKSHRKASRKGRKASRKGRKASRKMNRSRKNRNRK